MFSMCHGNIDDKDNITIYGIGFNIFACQNVKADFLLIINKIPKFFFKFRCIFQSGCTPAFIILFFYSKNNYPSFGIGKR